MNNNNLSGQSGPLGGAFFKYDVPSNEWLEFEAEGFCEPVTGVVYRTATPVRGMPMGGIGTGFMHLGPDGLLDRGTAFNTFLPPSAYCANQSRKDIPAYEQPLLGLTVGEAVWVLALPKEQSHEGFNALTDQTSLEGHASFAGNVHYAEELHYWGHYPVVDMEYETTAPVRVGARVWTPFLPGDEEASNTPGMVIEVRVRNTSGTAQKGSVIVNFPGFSETEALLGFRGAQMGLRGSTDYSRRELRGELNGILIHHEMEEYHNQVGYVLGVIGQEPARTGRDLSHNMMAWSRAGSELPAIERCEPGTSMAVDFELKAGEIRTVRFVLSWFAPFWQARQSFVPKRARGSNPYTHKYYDRFKSEGDVALYLAREHKGLLERILAWQGAMYASQELPGWLRDSLINIFHIIAQNSFWAVSRVPGHWAGAEGLFSMNESLPSCPQQQCIPCDFIANYPLLFFFPNLVERSIEAFTRRQKPSGEVPFIMGSGTELDEPCYGTQYSTDCQVYVHLVAQLWERTGDGELLRKYYPAVKKAVRFLQGVDKDDDGIVDVWGGSWFYEGFPLKGASVFVGGLWLCTLRLAGLMAREMGDDTFVEECRSWQLRASKTLEDVLWNEETGAYLLYHQPTTGSRSDVILADQLVGEWAGHFHGVKGVFPPERVRQAQETVWRINVAGCEVGARATMHPNRSPYQDGYIAAYATLTPAMVKLYSGDAEPGLELVRRMWHHITCRKGWTWDHPSHFQADGDRLVGHEYYHNTLLWAVPAALLKQDLAGFCAPAGLVDRILQAAQGRS